MELHQLQIKTAFLNGDLEGTIYMQQPEGYAEGGPNGVCCLRKSLYDLKQAPIAWNTRLMQESEAVKPMPSASGADAELSQLSTKAATSPSWCT